MKKIILFLLTVALALGGLGFAHAAVTDAQDELLVYPTLQLGDPEELAGLTASMTFACGDHLRWHTDYAFGGGTETEFVYHAAPIRESVVYDRTRMNVGFSGGFGSSTSGGYFSLPASEYSGLFRAVAATTGDGESMTMNLKMADHVTEYLPDFDLSYEDDRRECRMSLSLHGMITGDNWYEEEGNYREFFSAFRFPVREDHIVSVTVGKDDGGRIVSLEMNSENGPELRFISDVTAQGIFFVPVFQTLDGTPLHYVSPEGHGIYFMPWQKTGTIRYTDGDKDRVQPDVEQAKRIFPLEEGLIIESMEIDAEAGEAWMLTREGSAYFLTSCDLNSGGTLARIEVLPHDPGAEDSYARFMLDEDYVLVTAQENLALVDLTTRELVLTAPDVRDQQFGAAWYYDPDSGSLRFDGEQLVLINTTYHRDGTFWAAAFRQGELAYYGEYDCSLMRGNDDFYYSAVTVNETPVTLK